MQSACPQCGQKIAIDDAKVPERPFSVKCPKCQSVVRLPGRAPAAAPATAPPAAPEPFAAPPAEAASATPELNKQMLADFKREIGRAAGGLGRGLVALPDRNLAASVASVLSGLDITFDNLDNPEEGGRLIEQGVYALVVTARMPAAPGRESLLQRVMRLSPDSRRRVFLVVMGEEFRTGDGAQAFGISADMVLNPRDVASAANLLASTVMERKRLYQVYVDARDRFEASASS